MKTPKQIFEQLAKIAPCIALEVIWSHDGDSRFSEIADSVDGDANDWQAWNSEVKATAIVNGEIVKESAYLGSTWEKYGDNPAQSNPDISGYLPQMLEEALTELKPKAPIYGVQIEGALVFLKDLMQARYAEHQTAVRN